MTDGEAAGALSLPRVRRGRTVSLSHCWFRLLATVDGSACAPSRCARRRGHDASGPVCTSIDVQPEDVGYLAVVCENIELPLAAIQQHVGRRYAEAELARRYRSFLERQADERSNG
jgi:hypothetical protein